MPAKHLAAAAGWSGAPSGLVYENGTYHAFYPHNPTGDDAAGAVDWAHATSTDLVTWTEQPVAIAGSATTRCCPGRSCVDQDNTSGLGTADRRRWWPSTPPRDDERPVAGLQHRSRPDLAASTPTTRSCNRTGSAGLQDPKVFWYEQGGYWVLVAADGRRVHRCSSTSPRT